MSCMGDSLSTEQTPCKQTKQRSRLFGHPAARIHTLTQLPPNGRRADEKYTDEQVKGEKKYGGMFIQNAFTIGFTSIYSSSITPHRR